MNGVNILVHLYPNNIRRLEHLYLALFVCLPFFVFLCRSPRIRRSRRLHPGAIRGEKQIDHQRDLLSHDVCDGHEQHTVCVRRRHRRNHRQQSQRMRTVLDRHCGHHWWQLTVHVIKRSVGRFGLSFTIFLKIYYKDNF